MSRAATFLPILTSRPNSSTIRRACDLDERPPLVPGRSYQLKSEPALCRRPLPRSSTASISIQLAHLADKTLGLNEIGFCNLSTAMPVAFDPYAVNRDTGAFI